MTACAWCAILVALPTAGATTFSFTTLEFGIGTAAFGINNRDEIVGAIFTTTNVVPFLYSGGLIQTLPVPGIPSGINDSDQVVGSFTGAGAVQHAFLYSGGIVTTIDYPGAIQSQAIAINSAGVVYGEWEGSNGQGFGYLYQNGVFMDLDLPAHLYWSAQRGGINDAGVIGTTLLGIPGSPGVVWDHGTLTQVNYPGADFSDINGINDGGDLVGIYAAISLFSWAQIDGEFTTVVFDPPGTGDKVNAINDASLIIGTFPNQFGSLYTFVGEPVPEPMSSALACAGTFLLWRFGRRSSANSVKQNRSARGSLGRQRSRSVPYASSSIRRR
jgi:probable HAF family extracellular repeat protein